MSKDNTLAKEVKDIDNEANESIEEVNETNEASAKKDTEGTETELENTQNQVEDEFDELDELDELDDSNESDDSDDSNDSNESIEELLGEKPKNTVPLKTFLEIKKEKKELERKLKDVQGVKEPKIQIDLKEIADKYDVDPDFVNELANSIYAQAESMAEEKVKEKLQPLEEKAREERINKVFETHFNKVIEQMPELKSVVNKEVIKKLSLLPENSRKTFQQIIEETYGKTVAGKKTMETSTPRGGKDASLDMSRIHNKEYFNEVMSNPELKKKYNEGLIERIDL